MTLEEIRLLDTPALRDAVDANLERDPNAIALDKRLPHAALVATQVKYLQRARRKLPTYFAARAIIPSLAFEQASSEAAAACKTWSGNRCIDLTCGLGVDTLALSKAFGEVISIERDAVVAEIAKDTPYAIGFVPYTNPGAKLTFSIRDEIRAVERATGKKPSVIFMQNHGVIATHADADECVRIHDDINARVKAYFSAKDYPQIELNGNFSATKGLKERLASGRFGEEELLKNPLYPDQMVFFADTLFLTDEAPAPGKASLKNDGTVEYNMDAGKAVVIEETLAAIVYIIDGIEAKGFTVSTMSGAAQQFISGWESEKYRKSLVR